MSYVITKLPDGDVSLGNLNGEFVSLSDSISDYATGGYAIISGETANTNNTPNLGMDENAVSDVHKMFPGLDRIQAA